MYCVIVTARTVLYFYFLRFAYQQLIFIHSCKNILYASGTMKAEVMAVNVSQLVSITCQAVCGRLLWHINGTTVEERDSSMRGEYTIAGLASVCSESTSPDCPTCGCDNCNEADISQTMTSTLNITANRSSTVECFSHQTYEDRDYTLLLRKITLVIMECKNIKQ